MAAGSASVCAAKAADNDAGQAVESRPGESGRLGRVGRLGEVFGRIGLAGWCRGLAFLEIFQRLEGLEVFGETVNFFQKGVFGAG